MSHRPRLINGKYCIEVRRGFMWKVKYTFDNLEDQQEKLTELEDEKHNNRYFADLKFGCTKDGK